MAKNLSAGKVGLCYDLFQVLINIFFQLSNWGQPNSTRKKSRWGDFLGGNTGRSSEPERWAGLKSAALINGAAAKQCRRVKAFTFRRRRRRRRRRRKKGNIFFHENCWSGLQDGWDFITMRSMLFCFFQLHANNWNETLWSRAGRSKLTLNMLHLQSGRWTKHTFPFSIFRSGPKKKKKKTYISTLCCLWMSDFLTDSQQEFFFSGFFVFSYAECAALMRSFICFTF